MNKERGIRKLDFSDEFLLDSVEKRLQGGDYLGALTMLRKRNGLYEPSADAQALAADIYEGMELWQMAADSWFRFLDTCNEADFAEGFEGLAVCFMNMGNEFQASIYFHRVYGDNIPPEYTDAEELAGIAEKLSAPRLRLVHSEGDPEPETLERGLTLLKAGELETARSIFGEIPETSSDYPSAAGLSAMCTLMLGDELRAEWECAELLKVYPENVQALTTYCAVLGATGKKEEAKEVARRLADLGTNSAEDLYRVATALCETGLDEQAYEKLCLLRTKLPYDDNVLYFHAVAAYRTGRLAEAIDSLERLTTIYPRKAVAEYYLVRMRGQLDGGKPFPMNYYYRIPEDEYETIAAFLLKASAAEEPEAARLARLPQMKEFFRISFDEMDGRDEKLQMLAVKVAIKTRADDFLREILLDSFGDEVIKLSVLHELTMRNEEDSFGVVICNIYKEFFTHELDIEARGREAFLKAFADVYSKFAIFGDEAEDKLCIAAEDIYRSLLSSGAEEYFDERASLAAAIYREARIPNGERSFEQIVKLFEANKYKTEQILDYMM